MFGFLQGGILNVTVSSFTVPPNAQDSSTFKFTLDRTLSDATNPYLDNKRDSICIQDKIDENDHTAVARFSFDFKAKQWVIYLNKINNFWKYYHFTFLI